MRTQSVDTGPETERIIVEMIRKAPVSKRFRLVQSLTQSTVWSSIQAWQRSHQTSSEREAAIRYVLCSFGIALAQRVQAELDLREGWYAQPADLVAVMLPALHVFDELCVPYYLGGSIASSVHGMQQMARDIDLVINLGEQSLPSSLAALLQSGYIADEDANRQEERPHTPLSLIHLDTLMKVDVVLSKRDAFDLSMCQLVSPLTLDERYPPFRVASASEMILFKLQRYARDERSRTDGMLDDAEWNDILGMLKVQGPDLDMTLLEEWARSLDIVDTWRRALLDAGHEDV
jgi:hypothetical protein